MKDRENRSLSSLPACQGSCSVTTQPSGFPVQLETTGHELQAGAVIKGNYAYLGLIKPNGGGYLPSKFYRVDLTNGAQATPVALQGSVRSTALIAGNGGIYVTDFNGCLYRINESLQITGLRKFGGGVQIWSSPNIAPDGDILVTTDPIGGVVKLHKLTPPAPNSMAFTDAPGFPVTLFSSSDTQQYSSVAVDGDYAYVGGRNGYLYKVNLVAPTPTVTSVAVNLPTPAPTPVPETIYSSPMVYNNHVYIGSADNRLYQFSISPFQYVASFATSNDIYSSPVLGYPSVSSSSDYHVYIRNQDGKLYCLDPDLSGSPQVWMANPGSNTVGVPAMDTAYVSSLYKSYAYLGGQGQLVIVDPSGGYTSTTIGAAGGNLSPPAITTVSSSNKVIFGTRYDCKLHIID